jgi:hypothetical protein
MLTNEQQLHARAQRCRELADTAVTEEGRLILRKIADRYECEAATDTDRAQRAAVTETAA